MSKDSDMKDAGSSAKDKLEGENGKDEKAQQPDQSTPVTLEDVLRSNLKLIEKAVATKEARLLFGRLLRQSASVRSKFTSENISKFVEDTLPAESTVKASVLQAIRNDDEVCINKSAARGQVRVWVLVDPQQECTAWS